MPPHSRTPEACASQRPRGRPGAGVGMFTLRRTGKPLLRLAETDSAVRVALVREADGAMRAQAGPPLHAALERIGAAGAPIDGLHLVRRGPGMPDLALVIGAAGIQVAPFPVPTLRVAPRLLGVAFGPARAEGVFYVHRGRRASCLGPWPAPYALPVGGDSAPAPPW
jgi:hypothetical protein